MSTDELMLKNTLVKVTDCIIKINKEKLHAFFFEILYLNADNKLSSELIFIEEFNNFLIGKQMIQKENQINFCFFFSFIIRYLNPSISLLELVNGEIFLKGNTDKSYYITNILEDKKSSKIKVDITHLFSPEKNKIIVTTLLNKQKFNTMTFFAHLLLEYKYKFILTKTTTKNLLYVFYICRSAIRDNAKKKVDEEVKDYIENIIEFLEMYYNTI